MARPLRVCEFTPTLSGGGAEERIARVLASLDRSAFEPSWIGFGPVEHDLTDRAGGSVDVVSIPRNPNRGVETRPVVRVALALARLRPDVLHVHNWSTSLYGIVAAGLAGVPYVVYGEGGRDTPEGPSRRRRTVMRALAPHVDRFTAVCEFLGRELQSDWGVPGDRVTVIRNGADLDRIDLALGQRDARRLLGVPEEGLMVGMIAGRFRMVKRPALLIDAMERIALTHPNVHLVLVGDPLERTAELKSRARAAGLDGRFHLPGHVQGVSRVLKAFDVLVNCSIFEGASNSVIEAMAAGVAVVATAVGGTPELIESGKSGLLVRPERVDELASAIQRLLDDVDLRRQCGQNARGHIERCHTHAGMLAQYEQLYRTVSAPGSPLARTTWRRVAGLGESFYRAVRTSA